MSIANGQTVSAETDNAAFLSRKVDSDTLGVVGLRNTQAVSGPEILNAQAAINQARLGIPLAQSIPDGDPLVLEQTLGEQLIKCQSDVSQVDLSTTPFGSPSSWPDGCKVHLLGLSDTNFITALFADIDYGLLINGNIDLQRGVMLSIIWDEATLRWYEIGRNK